MNKLNVHISSLMRNKSNQLETSDSEYIQNGGDNNSEKHYPTGGFPPIFINIKNTNNNNNNNNKFKFIEPQKKERSVSINDILRKNYKVKSFI
jgi:hypothetical protein